MIIAKNITKIYGKHRALDDISFHIQSGQVTGLLGPNGAGKSTTMNILTGYITASSGEVTIDNMDIVEHSDEVKRLMGYLPEHPPLYDDMTVEEYLNFVGKLKRLDKQQQQRDMDKAYQVLHIGDVRSRLIKNLSKGYRQRIGMAQALLGSPKILILDEPTVGLDPQQILEMRQLIQQLRQDHSIILSSHILSEVQAVSDQIIIINKGKLIAHDSPQQLMKQFAPLLPLLVSIKGEHQRIFPILQALPHIENIEVLDSSAEICRYAITSELNENIKEALFFALAEAHLPIMHLYDTPLNLEDIFLSLTHNKGD
jgi:ABC-2 type transport system ATP-binding protein